MGKSRRNRARVGNRADPLSRPSKPPADPELAALREQKILPVLKDLQNTDPQKRTAAATAISNIIDDDKCRRLLLREQLLRILMQETLTDASPDAKAAGWEIIRAVAEREDAGFCVHLYRQDILTAIEFAAKTLSETFESTGVPFDRITKAQKSIVWRIAISICSLLGALAEAQDDILGAITKNQQITHFLFALMSRDTADRDALDECLTCVATLAEDNRAFAESLASSPAFDMLLKFKNVDGATAVLGCGVLHNVFAALGWNDRETGRKGATDECLIRRLALTIQDYKPAGDKPSEGGEWVAPDEIAVLALETLASIATGVQDTLAGGKPGEEEPAMDGGEDDDDDEMEEDGDEDQDDDGASFKGEGEGEEDGESEDEMDDDEIAQDMDLVLGADSDEDAVLDGLPTLESFLEKAVPQVLRLASPSGQPRSPTDIQIHAISVLNNLAWSLACVDYSNGQNEGLFKAWAPHGRIIWDRVVAEVLDSDTNDLALATEVTSLAWAVSKALGAELPLKEGQHQKFVALYHATKGAPVEDRDKDGGPEDPFQSLGVKCIGVLAQLGMPPAPLPLNRDVGVFLVTVVQALPQTAPAEAVEALNQLFDMYGDEDAACDEVFWKDGFLKHLEEAVPKTRAMLKGIRKNEAKTQELRDRAEEVVMNLERFIQYKRKHKRS